VTVTALRDPEGPLRGFAVLTRDVTEHEAAHAALRASEAKYRSLFERSFDGILVTRVDDETVRGANQAACSLFGYSRHELTSLRREQLVDMGDPKTAAALAGRAATGGGAAELTFIRKGGERFEARVASWLFTDDQGQSMAGISIHDITRRRQAEEALRSSEERFRLLYEHAPIGIVQIDANGFITGANRQFGNIIGQDPQDAIGFSYQPWTPSEDESEIDRLASDLLAGQIDTVNTERRIVRKDGSASWIRGTGRMVRDAAGTPEWGIVLYQDVTERKLAEDALRYTEERFRATFDNAPLGIAECTLDGRFIGANARLADMLGYTKDELTQLSLLDVTHPADVEGNRETLRKLAAGETEHYVIEKRYLRKDRSFVWVNVTGARAAVHGKPDYLVVAVEDITARKKVEEDLKRTVESSFHQATHDMLTGVANRTSFNARLKEALAYAKRDEHQVAVHVLDLDGFKAINDTLGHHVGDLLLKDAAMRLAAKVRATDMVARLGGDEFAIIQTHLTEASAAGVLAKKLVADLGRKYVLQDQEVHSGTSIGVALYPGDADDPGELIKQADLALYDAKQRGRDNYQFYRKELGDELRRVQQTEQALERALDENELCLEYQPLYDVQSLRVTGVEALLRWRHPTKGLLKAAEFVADAERAGMMPRIGQWTLQSACLQYKKWVEAGLDVPLTLNLSSMQLRDPRLLQDLHRVLEETGLPPSSLQLDLREGTLWDPRFSADLLQKMKDSGLRLALENFSAEMSALHTLERFPLDVVKPGQELVRLVPDQKREASIMSAIVAVAHSVNVAVCADGVEAADQLAAAKDQGCDLAQGYFLSKPLPVDEMTRLIERERQH
jgi:diguanylate cyclase (GGDEF)-like protein/PAS domain S-box-containing protein